MKRVLRLPLDHNQLYPMVTCEGYSPRCGTIANGYLFGRRALRDQL